MPDHGMTGQGLGEHAMWKWAVLLVTSAGCAAPAPVRSPGRADAPLSPTDARQADAALAGMPDDTAHDNVAGSWAMRLREQGKGPEAVEVAGRIRNPRIRAAVLAEVQAEAER